MRNFAPAILDRKIRFALVGCGRIANNHFGAILQHKERCELVGVCDIDPRKLEEAAGNTGANIDAAKAVGKLLAERAVKNGVTEVVFDRGSYLYHGRVKALADAAREAGLKF